jgi:kynureninase
MTTTTLPQSLNQAREADARDPLRAFRERFILPEGVIYMDGNSLGPLPRAARDRMSQAVEVEWGQGLVRSWNDAQWVGAPQRIGAKIARLIGAAPHEVVVADSTSVVLFKLLIAALKARPGRRVILTETGNFPTDLYVAQGIAETLPGVEVRAVSSDRVADAIDQDTAVVMLTHVHYKTAARHDMAAITAKTRAAGALALWDLSHTAGAIPVDLNAYRVDLAVGCGYKFLNGGPGAPAYAFVAERLQAELRSPITGWMGHAAAFAFSDDFRPAEGVARWLTGTPPVLSLLALEAGVDMHLEVDPTAVAEKSRALWDLFAARLEARCGGFGFEQITSRDADQRGSHLSLTHPEGYRIMQALIARGVIGDFRAPDVLRFAITPLYLRFEDVWDAAEILADILETEAWRALPPLTDGRVT